jgi:glycosyltransferase involved in cell wall biosynthesis
MGARNADCGASGQKRVKVLAITVNYPTPYTPTAGVFVRNVLDALRERDVDVEVVSPVTWSSVLRSRLSNLRPAAAPLPVSLSPRFLALPLSVTGVRPWAVAWNESRLTQAVQRAVRDHRMLRTGDTVIYAHFVQSARAALRACPGVPVVAAIGESDPWLYDEMFGHSWLDDLEACTAVVTVSRAGYDYLLRRRPALGSRLYCIPNGVDTAFFRPQSRADCRARLGLPEELRLAVFVGTFEERKGPRRVLNAARKAGCQVAFLGSGPQAPVGPEVVVAKPVSRDELIYWLGAADCFVLPSRSEGRSNAILEALACGVPVVVSDRPFNTEFVTPACGALVNPDSPADIARGMRHIMDAGHAPAMRRAARAVAEGLSLVERARRLEGTLAHAAGRRVDLET